jgi:hypothetical protein
MVLLTNLNSRLLEAEIVMLGWEVSFSVAG